MLMVIGKWDEFRHRMTHTRDIEKEWMKTEETHRVISHPNLQTGVTHGNFGEGTARRVVVPKTSHKQGSIILRMSWALRASFVLRTIFALRALFIVDYGCPP